jgi:hypothetical protein
MVTVNMINKKMMNSKQFKINLKMTVEPKHVIIKYVNINAGHI